MRCQIERSGRHARLLLPFFSLMKCDGVPIKKNQTRALQVLIDPAFSHTLILYNSPEEMSVRQQLIDVRDVKFFPCLPAVTSLEYAVVEIGPC